MMSLGFDDGEEKSIKEISKAVGISKDEVSNLRTEALDLLRLEYGVEVEESPEEAA
jgi:DNA-directed RNA polymerase specialized sigma subunit